MSPSAAWLLPKEEAMETDVPQADAGVVAPQVPQQPEVEHPSPAQVAGDVAQDPGADAQMSPVQTEAADPSPTDAPVQAMGDLQAEGLWVPPDFEYIHDPDFVACASQVQEDLPAKGQGGSYRGREATHRLCHTSRVLVVL